METKKTIDDLADGDLIICRCEEITKAEIVSAILDGADTVTMVKKMTRAGMGLCKGKTCSLLIQKLISEYLGKKTEEIFFDIEREPLRPVRIDVMGNFTDEDALVDHKTCLERL
jgi:NAD(P)H-nitrite reductase large subunit